ncbi:hypothetical protein [Streptomyces sp. NPDC057438]|uniref:hypothetical protein n=1 Tax=Streptomyces sp. NPDC057438 TaxID=3346133 RepID=UPI003677AEB0
MKKRFAVTGVTSAALIMTLATSGPAQALDARAVCATAGALGDVIVFNYDGATDSIVLELGVTDTDRDGHHARVRLITKNVSGTVKRWTWRANTEAMTSLRWRTVAHEDSGIFEVGVQVARFEKDKLLNSCIDWA